jgi:hypothetical protein
MNVRKRWSDRSQNRKKGKRIIKAFVAAVDNKLYVHLLRYANLTSKKKKKRRGESGGRRRTPI